MQSETNCIGMKSAYNPYPPTLWECFMKMNLQISPDYLDTQEKS
jgi:hypothetical protein